VIIAYFDSGPGCGSLNHHLLSLMLWLPPEPSDSAARSLFHMAAQGKARTAKPVSDVGSSPGQNADETPAPSSRGSQFIGGGRPETVC
jgi:hypothetical protein